VTCPDRVHCLAVDVIGPLKVGHSIEAAFALLRIAYSVDFQQQGPLGGVVVSVDLES
jgi:hypothetical protein